MVAARRKDAPRLDVETIVGAALDIIDREGLDGMSMRRLAGELGVDVAALYYHVPSKSALHGLIVDEIMSGMDLSGDDATQSPEARLVSAAYAYRAGLLRHPKALPLALGRSLRTVAQLRPIEKLLGIMYEAGLGPTEAIGAVDVIGQHVLGLTAVYAHQLAEQADGEGPGEFEPLDPAEFPHMIRALSEGQYMGFDAEFELGVRSLVRGLLATVEAQRTVTDGER